jgi:ubiquitin-protein ligase
MNFEERENNDQKIKNAIKRINKRINNFETHNIKTHEKEYNCLHKIYSELNTLSICNDNIIITSDEYDVFNWWSIIAGPNNTPYKNSKFLFKIIFPLEYPTVPPKYFIA